MNINQFINYTLVDIQKAIDGFNALNNSTKAEYPSQIEFDLAVAPNCRDGQLEVISAFDAVPRDVSRVSIKVNALQYPWTLKKHEF